MRYIAKVVSFVFVLVFSLMAYAEQPLRGPLLRSVTVKTDEGQATGVILKKGFVLTNFHVLHTYSGVKVDGKEACIVKADPKNDLLLLAVETDDVPTLFPAHVITQDDKIVVIGNPLGHKEMILHGRITDIADNKIYIDAHVFFGSSGSAVYNEKGELVGLVRGIEGEEDDGFPYGVVIPVDIVLRFLSN